MRRVGLFNVAGLGVLSAAAWTLHLTAGLAAIGISFLLLGRAAEG